MAVKQAHGIGGKIDSELYQDLNDYIEEHDSDQSKVIRKALREFLDKRKSLQPANRKNMSIVSK